MSNIYQALITDPATDEVLPEREVQALFPGAEAEDAENGLYLIRLTADQERTLLADEHLEFQVAGTLVEIEMP